MRATWSFLAFHAGAARSTGPRADVGEMRSWVWGEDALESGRYERVPRAGACCLGHPVGTDGYPAGRRL